MKTTAILLAGGKGSRLASLTRDKIMLRIGAGAVISWSVSVFTQAGFFDELIITYRDEQQRDAMEQELKRAVPNAPAIRWVQGGEERQDSVLNALESVKDGTSFVFIHDGARPFITVQDLKNLEKAVTEQTGAALATPVTDTIKRADRSNQLSDLHLEDLDRSRLHAMQTPQVFSYKKILEAYRNIKASGRVITDDVEAWVSHTGGETSLVRPEQLNFKITRPEDVELANFLIHTDSIKKVFELAYS